MLAALLASSPAASGAHSVLKVNDSVSVRFGFLGQTWADFSQNVRRTPATRRTSSSVAFASSWARRWARTSSFLFQTDNPILGRSGPGFAKQLGGGFITQDAYAEVKPGN